MRRYGLQRQQGSALASQRRGVRVRIARSRHGALDVDTIVEMVNSRRRLVIASAVSFKTGLKLDINALAEGVHIRGSCLLVDGIQALGATPVDAREVDFLVAASYKWLLGVHGVGILYVNQRLQRGLAPSYVGWRSVVDPYAQDRFTRYLLHSDARRFDEGMPNYLGLYVLEASLSHIRSTNFLSIRICCDSASSPPDIDTGEGTR